jgi:hypothetical protein
LLREGCRETGNRRAQVSLPYLARQDRTGRTCRFARAQSARPPNGRTSIMNSQRRYPCSKWARAYRGMIPGGPRDCAERRSGPDRGCWRRARAQPSAAPSRWAPMPISAFDADSIFGRPHPPTCRPPASSSLPLGSPGMVRALVDHALALNSSYAPGWHIRACSGFRRASLTSRSSIFEASILKPRGASVPTPASARRARTGHRAFLQSAFR